MLKQLNSVVLTRIVIVFISRLVSFTILPFMSIYFTNAFNSVIASLLLIIIVISQFVFSLYGGYLTDIVGRRKIILYGEVIKTIGIIGMVIFNSPVYFQPWLTFVMLVAISMAQGLITPAIDASLIDISKPEARATMYTLNYWVINLAIMIGIIIGGWFFLSHLFQLLIVLLIMSAVAVLLTVRFIFETYEPIKQFEKRMGISLISLIKGYKTVIKDVPYLIFTLGGVAILSIEYQRNNFIALRLVEKLPERNYGIGDLFSITLNGLQINSLLTVVNTISIVCLSGIVIGMIKEKAKQSLMYYGFILFAIGFSILAFFTNVWILLLGVIILSLGELIYVPCRQTILAEFVNEDNRGTYMAFNGLTSQLGRLIASSMLMLGPIIGGSGMAILILILGGGGIILSAIALQKKL